MTRQHPDLSASPDTTWRRTLAAADRAALRALARGWPLERVLTIICTAMERLIDGSACSVLLLDDDRKLHHGAAPHLPQAYNAAIDGLEIGPSAGSCGTAAYTGRQVVVEDIRESPLWADYRDLAETAGLRACWSTPIRDPERRTIGTFAIYFPERRGPTRQHLRTAAHMAALAAVAIGRRRADDAVFEAKARAEAASATKTTFLAGMSHELRTPLNAIIGFAEIMSAEMYGPLGSSRYQDYARIIAISGRHLLTLIDDLLDLSKIEAGRMTLSAEPVDLLTVAVDALSMAGADAGAVEIQAPDVPVTARGDRRALTQVALNLVSNALKFSRPDGRVALRIYRPDQDHAGLEVRDDGIGIPADRLAELGQPFVRVESDHKHKGTGLGLYISRSLVELQGGRLDIDSTEGIGTTVRVTLPVA